MTTLELHPTPWQVTYNPRFETWHKKSCPNIVDAHGETVLEIPMSKHMEHPGDYDAEADDLAQTIVNSINNA